MKSRRLLVVLTSLALLLSATAGSAIAAKPTGVGIQKVQNVKKIGTTRIVGSAAKPVAADPNAGEVRPDPDKSQEDLERLIHGSLSAARVPSAHVPRPATLPVVDATGTFHRPGLNHYDQRNAGSGAYANTQFSLEPPDQALCVGNNFVVESVNTAIRVRNATTGVAGAAMALNQFFGLAPEINRATLVYGDFSSDPKCYYDDATDQWFVTLLQISVNPATGAFLGHSKVLIAVSATGDPNGVFTIFSIDTTNDGSNGTPNHAGCPCFGDQPLIGADAYGFYVTTNEYPIFTAGFHGAMVYAMSKTLTGGLLGTVVSIHEPNLAEGPAYTLQPATTPPAAEFATANNGTEFFLSALEFTGGLDNRIAVWSLTNTASLSTTPDLTMQVKVLDSEVYGAPPAMIQKDGLTPLRDLIKLKAGAALLGVKQTSEARTLLNSNDDRMNQAVYVNGQVWGALNTVVKSPTGPTRTAIAWFSVSPSFSSSGILAGAVSSQGYIAVQNNNVAFPAIAANAAGSKVIVAFSLVGPDFYPSSAYATLSPAASNVKVVSWGVGPADGFTGYPSEDPGDGGVERWGDYSAAATDESGNLWFATESINQACSMNDFINTTFWCGETRTLLANWGTTIAKVAP